MVTFGFGHYANNACCHLCGASRVDPTLSFKDFSRQALWRATKGTHEEYMASLPEPPPLAKIHGSCLTRVHIDSMHSVDMGVTPCLLGGFIAHVAASRDGLFGGERGATFEARLAVAYEDYVAFCKRERIAETTGHWTKKKEKERPVRVPKSQSKSNQ